MRLKGSGNETQPFNDSLEQTERETSLRFIRGLYPKPVPSSFPSMFHALLVVTFVYLSSVEFATVRTHK